MARYIGPVSRLERRLGKKLHLKGERDANGKSALERRNFPPGQHGQTRNKLSTYGVQLREKQTLKWIYGVLERQFRRYMATATRYKGVTGTVLLQLLESRLDNVVYRAGFASTRAQARQLVSHKHVFVNGKAVNIASYQVKPGDVVSLSEKAKGMKLVADGLSLLERKGGRKAFLEFNQGESSVKFLQVPAREDLDDIDVKEQLVVELYSR
ncbi:MAG TPA: 30S ribosomal protein S4 [Candidatus Sumerlaeota bacterium]|nr:30S ribosomal protein S4 [Candidatus Sumerlaeota bacterium]